MRMKKFYTLMLCLLMLPSAWAKELTFYIGDTPITPGESVTFTEYTLQEGKIQTQVKYDPHISLMSDKDANNVVITMTSISGENFQLCAGGQCESSTSITKKNVVVQGNQKLDLQFEFIGMYKNGSVETPTVSAKIEAMYNLDKNSKREFVITMGPDASVSLIETTEQFTPENRSLTYNLGEKSSTVTVYDATGRQRATATVSGYGSIDLSQLPAGLYIYRAQGGVSGTAKFIIR